MEKYDIIIIGAGPGGYVAALYAAEYGKKVLLIEKNKIGGVCLNCGCIPTKSLIESINVFNFAKKSQRFGIDIPTYTINYKGIKNRKDQIVETLKKGIESLLKAKKITLKIGVGKLVDKNVVEVNNNKFTSENLIIATGTSPKEIPSFKFDKNRILSSSDLLEQDLLPTKLLIVGGGVNGCEYAYIYASLGVKVTLIEMMDRLLPTMDKELGKTMERLLKKLGVNVITNTAVQKPPSEYDKIVVCIGRQFNTKGIGLERLNIHTEKGRIVVDNKLRTNIPNIYAVGDVTGGYLLAYVASHEGIVACDNILGKERVMEYTGVPICIYTKPQIASVGLTEQEAEKKGYNIRTIKFPFRAIGKSHIIDETEGFCKIVGDIDTDEILGVHIVGPEAALIIGEASLAVKNRMKVKEITELIHAHPTLTEVFMEAAFLFEKRPLHTI